MGSILMCYVRYSHMSSGCVIGNADLNVSDASGDRCLFYTLALLSNSNSGAAAATAGAGAKRRHKRSTVTTLDSLPPTFEALHQVLLRGFELAPERPAAAAPSSASAAAAASSSQSPQPMDVDLDLTAGSDVPGASGGKARRGSPSSAAAAGASSSGASGMLSGILSRITGALSSSSSRSNNTIGGAKNWGLSEPVPLAVLLAAYLLQHGADANLSNRSHVCISS